MVKAVLLEAYGIYREIIFNPHEYSKHLGEGTTFMQLPVYKQYVRSIRRKVPMKTKLVCFAHTDGYEKRLEANRWTPLLQALGIAVNPSFPTIYGDIIMMNEHQHGDDKVDDIDIYILNLIREFSVTGNEEAFIQSVYETKPKSKKRKSVIRAQLIATMRRNNEDLPII